MDEDFGGGRGQGGPEACNVTEVKEGSFGDVVGVGEEREGGVEKDAKVADLEGVTMEPSIFKEKVWVERVREFGPMMSISDLLELSLRKFSCIHDFISVRQEVRVEWVTEVMVLEER